MLRPALVLALLPMAPLLAPEPPASSWARPDLEPLWGPTAAFYRDGLRRHGVVGSSLWLVRDGEVAARARHGWQDVQAGVPVDDETIYHWASITKTLTAIAVLQLREQGRLRLDDPVVSHLPELRQAHNPFGPMTDISLRHLLSHCSGFRDPTWTWGGDRDWQPFEPPAWKQLEAMLPYTEVLFRPGSRYGYSNPGVVYLGRVVELLTNEDYEVYVAKNIFMPLGMHRSFFDRSPPHLLPHRSHSYARDDAGLKEARFDFDTGVTVSNGGWNAPLGDLARYLAFLLGDAGRQAEYDRVLPRRVLEEMWRPQIAADEPGVSVGLGFFLEKRGGLDLVGHYGRQNGFYSHFYLHPASRAGYVVAYNTDATSTKPVGEDTAVLDRALREQIVERVFKALAR
jgi:CubicO group peptidase (beta-lactamase class C family)